MKNTINFMYWAHNQCVPTSNQLEWFEEVFGQGLAKHFMDKWNGRRGFNTSTEQMLMWFFFELNTDYKEMLINWVDNNYNSGI